MRESGDADPLASARAVRAFLESPAVLDPFEAADGFLPSGVAEGSSTQLPADPSAPSGGKRMINGKPQKVT